MRPDDERFYRNEIRVRFFLSHLAFHTFDPPVALHIAAVFRLSRNCAKAADGELQLICGRRRKRRITNDPERRSQLYPLPPACSAIRDCSLERDPGTKTPPPSPHPCRRSAPHTDDGRRRKRRITNDPERRSQLYPLPPACSAIRVCSLQVLCAVLLVELVVFRPECRVFEP